MDTRESVRESSGAEAIGKPEKEAGLEPVQGSLAGIKNLMGKENGEWASGWSWILHGAIWLFLVAGAPLVVAFVRTSVSTGVSPQQVNENAVLVFFAAAAVASVIAVVAKTQGAVIGEKQLGTAAFVLSKPASRKAFILAKLAVHIRWLAAVTLIVPAVIFYTVTPTISGLPVPLLPFLGGLGIMALGLLFYLTLSLLLGTLFDSRGALAGLVFGFLVAGLMLSNYTPWLTAVFPWLFFEWAYYLTIGDPIPAAGPASIIAAPIWSALFIGLALWRFERTEV